MPGRIIAIGDIHGCSKALRALINVIAPDSDDTVVILGDFIDRGPDSCSVVNFLMAISQRCQLVPLLGDHEEMLLNALDSIPAMQKWMSCGGAETLRSYGCATGGGHCTITDWIPESHWAFLRSCGTYLETKNYIFMHANFLPELPMEQQPRMALFWRVTHAETSVPHYSGKTVVVGHTPQRSGEVLDLGFLVCIDTNCVRGGWLSALDVSNRVVWQADNDERTRIHQLDHYRHDPPPLAPG